MKNIVQSPLLRIIPSILLGVTFILFPNTTLRLIVTALGAFIAALSLITLLFYNEQRKTAKGKSKKNIQFPLVALSALLLGSSFFVVPSFYVGILMYILATLLILAGVYKILFLSTARKSAKVTAIYYVMPILILFAGIVVFVNPFATSASMLTLFGITTLLYALCEIVDYIKFK